MKEDVFYGNTNPNIYIMWIPELIPSHITTNSGNLCCVESTSFWHVNRCPSTAPLDQIPTRLGIWCSCLRNTRMLLDWAEQNIHLVHHHHQRGVFGLLETFQWHLLFGIRQHNLKNFRRVQVRVVDSAVTQGLPISSLCLKVKCAPYRWAGAQSGETGSALDCDRAWWWSASSALQ